MKVRLWDILKVQSWYYLRPKGYWDVVYLQAKDFDAFWDLNGVLVSDLDSSEVQEGQILLDWDILFVAKWTRSFATVYRKAYWKCVASSTFFILRIYDKNAMPEYLAILLSEASKSRYFHNNTSWWYIQTISKSTLLNYELNIPALDKQKKIIKYYELYKRRLKLYEQLKEKNEFLTYQLVLQSNTINND